MLGTSLGMVMMLTLMVLTKVFMVFHWASVTMLGSAGLGHGKDGRYA